MLEGEKEAKKQNDISEKLQVEVAEEMVQIEERTQIVTDELAEAGPALERAQNAVKGNLPSWNLCPVGRLVKKVLWFVVCGFVFYFL